MPAGEDVLLVGAHHVTAVRLGQDVGGDGTRLRVETHKTLIDDADRLVRLLFFHRTCSLFGHCPLSSRWWVPAG
jgi:hypothetical protein